MSAALRYGIVGAGYFGRELGRLIDGIDGAVVTTVYSPEHATDLAEELGCSVAASVDDLAAQVDVVVVASPNSAHLEPVLRAAENGAHVFCEKPIALSYADCDAMVSACERAGVVFMAGHVMHFMPGVRRTAALIADGAIGDVVVARSIRTGWEDGSAAPGWKKDRATSGGHLYHHIHELDVLQHLIAPAERATMIGGAVPHAGSRTGNEDALLLASLAFPGDRYATLDWGSVFRRPQHEVTIQGTLGYVTIDMHDVGVTLTTADRVERFPLHTAEEDAERTAEHAGTASGGGVVYGDPTVRPPRWLRSAMQAELDYFHGLVAGTHEVDPALVSLTDGSAARASIATADALTLSMAEGRTVAVNEITGAGRALASAAADR
ncbi:Gfo/Idh/MocA family protein [Microbacterium sp. Root61]|uniref:Gfo/Idh/MocA family protein n=1 Tax=Microbacterium sp. Root61 TaxID=1736570 RepID=UPI000AD96011|nr:Gfo/Idh/MocA family oxidoreductase [Microbacterium sp. Root61]